MEKAMLTFDKVNAHYGKIQALHDVSLHINQGEIVTLIGANGAGKTTLLGTLCGDPRATSGRIVLTAKILPTGRRLRSCVKRWRCPERRVFSRMTVEENLAMGGFFAHRDEFQTRIKWVYELFPRLWERRIQRAGHHVRRRAADAGHSAHPAHRRQGAASRRADRGACARHVQRDRRCTGGTEETRHDRASGRAELPLCRQGRRPLLPHGSWRGDGKLPDRRTAARMAALTHALGV
jgi:ABC-type Fe3+/spermidine/putrescine transport system ATPase subunit